ncbi:unnamed protein product [Linum tenue]|uniref:Uncharacterized protein n=1 Tax=Linum tenue TaxID=586396 RepID=A0AAV0H6L4_9ROSI|nr:unnamed protein product [Linum tenue]
MGYYVNNNFLVLLRVLLIVTTAALLLASPWAAATSSNSATIRPSGAVYVRGGDHGHGCGSFFSRKLSSGRFNEPDRGGFNEPNPAKGG